MKEETIIKLIECKTNRLITLQKKYLSRTGWDEKEISELKKEINDLEKKLK